MSIMFRMLILSVLFLSGCQVATDLRELQTNLEELQADWDEINSALKAELNMDAQVGWNIRNGVLEHVTVQIPAQQAQEYTIQELKDLSFPIIMEYLDDDPQVYQLVVVFPKKDLKAPAVES